MTEAVRQAEREQIEAAAAMASAAAATPAQLAFADQVRTELRRRALAAQSRWADNQMVGSATAMNGATDMELKSPTGLNDDAASTSGMSQTGLTRSASPFQARAPGRRLGGGAPAGAPLLHGGEPVSLSIAEQQAEATDEKMAAGMTSAQALSEREMAQALRGGDVLELGTLMPGDTFGETVVLSARPQLVERVLQQRRQPFAGRSQTTAEGLPPEIIAETIAPATVLCDTGVEVLLLNRRDVYECLSFESRQALRELAHATPTSLAVTTPAQRLAWQAFRQRVAAEAVAKHSRHGRPRP